MATTDKPFVLLVDDNEATGALVTAILQREFNVEIAIDGLDAIERLKTKTFAAILLDLRMPQLDGFGVLDHLQSQAPQVLGRVIVLTAAVSRQDVARAKAYRVAAVIGKPFDVEHLLGTVRSCAGTGGSTLGNVFSSGIVFLLADLLRQRWL